MDQQELFTALSEKIPKSEKERLKGVLDDMEDRTISISASSGDYSTFWNKE